MEIKIEKLDLKIIFRAFLREQKAFLFPVVLILLQLFILFLIDVKSDIFIYTSILNISLLLVFFLIRFLFFYKRVNKFIYILNNLEFDNHFDKHDFSLIENIALLKLQKLLRNAQKADAQHRELILEQEEYFMLWLHQIKTPIAAMDLLLQKNKTGDDFQMRKALLSIDSYTQMALHYLKLQTKNSDLDFAEFSIDTALQNIFRKYRCFFIYKNIVLNYKPVNLSIITDSILFETMIEQIISNALKYSCLNQKAPEITVFVENTNSIVIKDNGTGISASDLPKVFDKGYCGQNGKNMQKATGIGLYLAKKIADSINCKIEIKSKLGYGTTVRVKMKK
ncbi:MAG: ATP-binding protein [Treponema sp.]|nr:MAG: ATP-binding protein [Treponema sp.]